MPFSACLSLALKALAALAYLYSAHSLANIRPENARAVLAAACLLGRMDDLCNYAYEICRQSISLDTLPTWLEFVESLSPPPSDGSSTPIVEQHQHTRTAIFGPYAQRLRDDVFNFLVVTLPNLVNFGGQATPTTPLPEGTSQHADAGRETLLQVFARVPFDLFKAAVESTTFHFGKSASPRDVPRRMLMLIAQRPRTHASSSQKTPSRSASRASHAGRARRKPSCSRSVAARAACSSHASSAGVSSGKSTTPEDVSLDGHCLTVRAHISCYSISCVDNPIHVCCCDRTLLVLSPPSSPASSSSYSYPLTPLLLCP